MTSLRKKKKILREDNDSEELFVSLPSPKKSKKTNSSLYQIDELETSSSMLASLLSKAGYFMMKKDIPNCLNCDQAVFQKELKKMLKIRMLSEQDVVLEEFMKHLDEYFGDITKLKWSLLYTQTSAECTNARSGQQDSLVRLLLNIDVLQPMLIAFLTEKLLETAYDDQNGNQKINIPKLILTNLRWLDHIVDPELLFSKVSDLLEGSPTEVQKEVINFCPHIIDDRNHPKCAEVLSALYHSNPELIPTILDSLPYLSLQEESLQHIYESVLKTLQTVKPANLPIVIKFLLNNMQQTSASEGISDIREKIQLPGDSNVLARPSQVGSSKKRGPNLKENIDFEVLFFSNIKMSILVHKYLAVAWIKVIVDICDPLEMTSFDLLMLIVLHDVVPARRKTVESILRNKIRQGLPVESLLKPTFSNHSFVLDQYFETVRRLASVLLRSTEPAFIHFGSSLYKYSFASLEGHQQEVILSLLAHMGDNDNVRILAISLLSDLTHEFTHQMSKYSLLLRSSLDLLDLLTLREAKKLMDAIIHLAYSSDQESALKDELNILIRKQLSQSNMKYKRLGVLSAVLTIKNSVSEDLDENEENFPPDVEPNRIVSLPPGPLQEAKGLFEMVKSSTLDSPQCSALFMDELASNILRNGLNKRLEEWISSKIRSDFEDTFVEDQESEKTTPHNYLEFSFQYDIEPAESDSEVSSITIPILDKIVSGLVNKSDPAKNDIITIAPHFRLLRMVESHMNSGDLSEIDALLGCSIQLPTPNVYDKFESLSSDEKNVCLSCLFYTVNWFRELINAFATQKEAEYKKKVYDRLRQVIELEKLLASLLPLKEGYIPPAAIFDSDYTVAAVPNTGSSAAPTKKKSTGASKKGKKRKIDAETCPTQSQLPTPATPVIEERAKVVADLKNYRCFFREFHLDVFNLLFKTLGLDRELENSGHLTQSEADFLLTDLIAKLRRVFDAGNKKVSFLGKSVSEKEGGFSHLELFSLSEVAMQVSRFVKPVCVHLDIISTFFKGLIEQNDGIEDTLLLFTENVQSISNLFTLLLKVLQAYLGWSGFQLETNQETLLVVLRTIAKKLNRTASTQMSRDELLKTSFAYICQLSDSVVNIGTSVVLVQLLETLIYFTTDRTELQLQIVEVIIKFLKKEWFSSDGNKDRGTVFNLNVDSLLQILFRHSDQSLDLVHTITSTGVKALTDIGGNDPVSETFPTICKSTLNVYYQTLLINLVRATKKTLSTAGKNDKKQLDCWNISIKIYHILIEILKTFRSSNLLARCLKNSRSYLELFLRLGMPLMDRCFPVDQQEVLALIKNLQISTRYIQHICTHSKLKQDAKLMQFVPSIKRHLESLIFRVKLMLTVNAAPEGFWMGDLKNKDLHGKEIQTQVQMSSDEESSTEDNNEEGLSDVELDEEESNSRTSDNDNRGSNYSASV